MSEGDVRRAFEMCLAGVSFDVIAEQAGFVSVEAAERAVAVEVAKRGASDGWDSAAVEIARLDKLHRVVWLAALDGDLKAMNMALKISDRRMRLVGAQPTQVSEGDSAGVTALDELDARRAARSATSARTSRA